MRGRTSPGKCCMCCARCGSNKMWLEQERFRCISDAVFGLTGMAHTCGWRQGGLRLDGLGLGGEGLEGLEAGGIDRLNDEFEAEIRQAAATGVGPDCLRILACLGVSWVRWQACCRDRPSAHQRSHTCGANCGTCQHTQARVSRHKHLLAHIRAPGSTHARPASAPARLPHRQSLALSDARLPPAFPVVIPPDDRAGVVAVMRRCGEVAAGLGGGHVS